MLCKQSLECKWKNQRWQTGQSHFQSACFSKWISSCTSSNTPGSGRGQESSCSELSRFRGHYTQQRGEVIEWGQPRAAIHHQDGSCHVRRCSAGQKESAVGHFCLVACSLQRNGLEGTSSLCTSTTWEYKRKSPSLTVNYKHYFFYFWNNSKDLSGEIKKIRNIIKISDNTGVTKTLYKPLPSLR